jgi:hypothetical protein
MNLKNYDRVKSIVEQIESMKVKKANAGKVINKYVDTIKLSSFGCGINGEWSNTMSFNCRRDSDLSDDIFEALEKYIKRVDERIKILEDELNKL